MLYRLIIIVTAWIVSTASYAEEGMWLPHQIHVILRTKLSQAGCQISPETIYSTSHPSIKDAVVSIGGFCSGSFISPDGLILTNHHCAVSALQSISTPNENYLDKGFNAQSFREEKPLPDLWIRVLVRIDEVTPAFKPLQNYSEGFGKRLAFGLIADSVVREAVEYWSDSLGISGLHGQVRSFFQDRQYFLMLYQEILDIRLVIAPPFSVGKFGGNQDNWMWPRHTPDFAIFRAYVDTSGTPTEYSPTNIPYTPRYYLPISLQGVQPDDFTAVIGFPGRTQRYLPPHDIIIRQYTNNPAFQHVLEIITHEMKRVMETNSQAAIDLSNRYAQLTNLFKYTVGQQEGLFKYGILQQKIHQEYIPLWEWANDQQKKELAAICDSLTRSALYIADAGQLVLYLQWLFTRPNIRPLIQELIRPYVEQRLSQRTLWKSAFEHIQSATHKPYSWMEHRIVAELLRAIYTAPSPLPATLAALQQIPFCDSSIQQWHTSSTVFQRQVRQIYHQYMGTNLSDQHFYRCNLIVDSFFQHSALFQPHAMRSLVRTWSRNPEKALREDNFLSFLAELYALYAQQIRPAYARGERLRQHMNIRYQRLLFQSKPIDSIYPDANGTFRFTYGSVQGYQPKDAVTYHYQTLHHGLLEKYRPDKPDFNIPYDLLQLLKKKDFGRFADDQHNLPICFVSTTDISGGNSGSPTIDAYGRLVGVAFDSNWEGIIGDILYIPETNRTISVDVRFILWYIQRYLANYHVFRSLRIIQ